MAHFLEIATGIELKSQGCGVTVHSPARSVPPGPAGQGAPRPPL
jgi:hypothetical protein